MIKPIIIEDAVDIGAVDITLEYNGSLFAITEVGNGSFDATMPNLERNRTGKVRIVAFQMANPGLNGRVTLCSIKLAGDLTDIGSLNMTVNTLKDATPQGSPIDSNVHGLAIAALSPTPSPTSTSDGDSGGGGGGGMIHIPTPTPAPFPAIASVTGTPVKARIAMEAPTPEPVMELRTEPPSLPPPILSPTAGIVIVAVAAIFGIVMVIRATEDLKKATIATIGIVIVAVAATIGMMLM